MELSSKATRITSGSATRKSHSRRILKQIQTRRLTTRVRILHRKLRILHWKLHPQNRRQVKHLGYHPFRLLQPSQCQELTQLQQMQHLQWHRGTLARLVQTLHHPRDLANPLETTDPLTVFIGTFLPVCNCLFTCLCFHFKEGGDVVI